ncbi:MAG TPA: calcium-binding protein [Allosphingosinicella sp.]|nr:calcium-binding protein [Allosphingosinicella sp.]
MKTFAMAGIVAAGFVAVPALAAQQGPARADQPLTRAAVEARVQARFARVDADRDGFISQAEARTIAGQRAERRVQRGARGDRSQRRANLFARLDSNRDGAISRAEFEAHAANRENRVQRAPHAPFNGERGFARIDANGDGRISLAEVTARRLARFDRLDTDRDGVLSLEERRAARALRQNRPNG